MNISNQEGLIAKQLCSRHAIMFSYARQALIAIIDSLGAKPGDEVILPAVTCKVMPLSILSMGLKPVYADVRIDTLNLDVESVYRAISSKTRAIVFQHTYGQSRGVEDIVTLANQKNIPLLEDCAQCMPYSDVPQSPGHWGLAAIFSNNLRKPLPAGSGGLAITNDDQLAKNLKAKRDAMPDRGHIDSINHRLEMLLHRTLLGPRTYWLLYELKQKLGGFYREYSLASEIASEVSGLAYRIGPYQVDQSDKWRKQVNLIVDHRKTVCSHYTRLLKEVDGIELFPDQPLKPLYFFPVLTERKELLLNEAKRRNLEVVGWPLKTPIFPVEQESKLIEYGYQPGSCPGAEKVAARLVGLPTDPATKIAHCRALAKLVKQVHQTD